MNVSYGGPGLAYTNYQPVGPQGLQYAQAMRREYEGFGEYGVVASSRNLTRLRRKLADLKKKRKAGFKYKFQRKANANRIKRTRNKIANLVKKAKKQITKRRSKGRKLSGRLRRLQAVSKSLQRQRKRSFQGKGTAVPRWFMKNSKRRTRVERWTSMNSAQRRAAFERYKSRRSSGQSSSQQLQMLKLRAMPLPMVRGDQPDGRISDLLKRSGWSSQWDQQDGQTRGGAPTAYPDFTERGAPSGMEMDDDMGDDVGDEIDDIEEAGAKNKIWIYAGLGLAGIAGVYFLTKKKTPAKRSRSRTKAR